MKPCAAVDCENEVSETSGTGFCVTCLGALQKDFSELVADIDKTLRLEAQFVAYCFERGLPHPHE